METSGLRWRASQRVVERTKKTNVRGAFTFQYPESCGLV